MALLSLAIAGVVIVQMYLLSMTIDAMAFGKIKPPTLWWCLLLILVLIRFVLIWIREKVARRKTVKIKSSLRNEVFTHLLDTGYPEVQRWKTGSLVATVTEGVEKLEDYFTKYIPAAIHIAILPLTIIVFTIGYDWISGLILLLTAPLILFFMMLIGTHAKRITQRQWTAHGDLSARFLDTLQGLKTLKIFGAGSREQEVVARDSDRYRVVTMEVLRIAFLSGFVLELAASISIALVAVQVGIRLIEGVMLYQAGLFILMMAPEFYLPFRLLGAHHHAGMEGAASATSVFSLTQSSVFKATLVTGTRQNLPDAPPSVTCDNVTYTYPNTGIMALNRCSCSLPGGAITAIVGGSGAGKSTLMAMVMGYLHPQKGTLMVSGIPLSELDTEWWRTKITLVGQHPHFFNTTILENLRLASPRATNTQIEEASMQAGAHQFIRSLPKGYHTPLYDNAASLSGGEKQRLAIARAFLKDAPLLILDEPTSNLDPESEHHVARATELLVHQRTTLIVAHRLQTVRMADQILVMDRGSVVESGTHAALIMQQGIYAGYIRELEYNTKQGL